MTSPRLPCVSPVALSAISRNLEATAAECVRADLMRSAGGNPAPDAGTALAFLSTGIETQIASLDITEWESCN